MCEFEPRPVTGPGDKGRQCPFGYLRRKSMIAALALLGVLMLCVLAVADSPFTTVWKYPEIERPQDIVWLPQNWTEDQRRRYYHTAQGSELLPYAWFLALEQPRFSLTGAPPFREQ